MSEVLLVTGMSGAGRSTVSAALEDLGWFVIDNMPIELDRARRRTGRSAARASTPGSPSSSAVGRRAARRLARRRATSCARAARERQDPLPRRARRRADPPLRGQRGGATPSRRRPWPTRSRASASPLQPIRDGGRPGDRHRFDQLQPAAVAHRRDLRRTMAGLGHCASRSSPSATPFGLPRDVDLVFDCRFLPNPHWVEELATAVGARRAGRDFVLGQEPAQHFLDDVVRDARRGRSRRSEQEGKSYLIDRVRLHRAGGTASVAIAEEVARASASSTPSSTATSRDEAASSRSAGATAPPSRCAPLRRLRRRRHRRRLGRRRRRVLGRLRELLDVVAVGDLRKCLVALAARAPARRVLRAPLHRRASSSGHPLGNLMLVGLIDATGDLEAAVTRPVAQLMGVTGAIVPASHEGVVLRRVDRRRRRRGARPRSRVASAIDASSVEPRTPPRRSRPSRRSNAPT